MASLVDTLIKEGLVTVEQVGEARDKQVGAKRPIQDLLVEMGFMKEEALMQVSSRVFKMPVSEIDKEGIDVSLIKLIPYEIANRYGVFPVRKDKDMLVLAMSNPIDLIALDDIRAVAHMGIKPILSARSQIATFIDKHYQSDEMLYDLLKNVIDDKKGTGRADDSRFEHRFEVDVFKGESGPVPKLINFILSDAVRARASDIHIEPQENSVRVRFRLDGELRDIIDIPQNLLSAAVSRIKVMSDLDLAEHRKPQDGRTSISAYGRNIDLRISIIPTHHGEKVVLRLLDPHEAKVELEKVGLMGEELEIFKRSCARPQGMVLVTGPTGSGKTSTLYAALNFVKSETKNIVTIEDPIEYLIEGVNQIQINPIKDVTFANGLKSILRQDPNIILVGEIRDKETAEIAFRSSQTGHLVFSTLHTNNTVASITRLRDIGLDPYLISSSLVLIIAQRLVKLICTHCKEEITPEKKLIDDFSFYLDEFKINKFYKGRGCPKCRCTGYLGRTGIFEVLSFSDKIKELVTSKASETAIAEEAKRAGMKTLIISGLDRVAKGSTTLEEVARVIGVSEEKIPEKKEKSFGRKRILVVDDSQLLRTMIMDALKESKSEFEFTQAEDGSQAIKLVYEGKPDLIITDVMMPKMDGYELVRELRSNLETASLPIVMLTTKSDKKSEIKGLDAGADDYMAKPFDKERLVARVEMLLKRRG